MAQRYPVRQTDEGAMIVDSSAPSRTLPPPTADAPFGTILGDLVDNTRYLVRQEVELVKTEVMEQTTEKAKGIGLLVGAGIFALFGLGFLGVMLIFGLQEWFGLSGWLSALLVMLLYFIIAALLGFIGKNILLPAPDDDTAA